MGYPGWKLVQPGGQREEVLGLSYPYPPIPTPHKEQLYFHLVRIVEFYMRFCLKRLCYFYVSMKSTAIEASPLRAREHCDLQRKNSVTPQLIGFFFLIFIFCFLGLYLRHMEVPRLGTEQEPQLPAYPTATATRYLSRIFDLHHSSWQRRSLTH